MVCQCVVLSSHSSSQSHRLTSFGDVEITGSRGRDLAGVCPAGVFVGLFCDAWGTPTGAGVCGIQLI